MPIISLFAKRTPKQELGFFFNELLQLNDIAIVDTHLLSLGNDYVSNNINSNILKKYKNLLKSLTGFSQHLIFFVYLNNN